MATHVRTGTIGIGRLCRRRSSVSVCFFARQIGAYSMLFVCQRASGVHCQSMMRHAALIPRHPRDALYRQGNEQQAQKKCP
jgi:hypothetical protein